MAAVCVNLIILALIYAPVGLRQAEIEQVAALNFGSLFTSEQIIDFPYKLLQLLSTSLFGLTVFSIKLPSIIIGSTCLVGIFWLIRRWINRRTATITTVLLISNSHLLFLAQDGTTKIMLLFWQVLVLVLLTKISQLVPTAHQLKTSKNLSQLALLLPVLMVVAGLSLYTPLALLVFIVSAIALFAHPKLRLYLSCTNFKLLLPGVIAFLLIIGPLLLQIIKQPALIIKLSSVNFSTANWWQAPLAIIDFWSEAPQLFVQPMFGLGTMIIILIGLYFLIKQSFSARGLIMLLFFGLSLIMTWITQDPSVVMLLPLTILLGYGIHNLTLSWMSIFPVNPYPRFVGTVIMGVMIIVLVFAGSDNLFKNYAHTPSLARQFSQDLSILRNFIKDKDAVIIVTGNHTERDFYQKIHKDNLTVTSQQPREESEAVVIYTHEAHAKLNMLAPKQILTDHFSQDFDRFYVY